MRNKIFTIGFGLLCCLCADAQDIFGKWKTISSSTGEVRSIVEVFEKDGRAFGKVLRIMDKEDRDNRCTDCEGEDKNKKIEGLTLLKGFEKDGDEYVDGEITDPRNGKVYRSKIWLDDDNSDVLNIRGYIGIFFKTMHWERLIEGSSSGANSL